jgi:ketosteroid isomerase-like protein
MSSAELDFPVFTAMLRNALGERVDESATFLAMLVENVVIEHPYAPKESRHLLGKTAIVVHLQNKIKQFTVDCASARQVYHCEPSRAVIIEFDLTGRLLPTDDEYQQQCVAIVETAGGRIIRYRSYVVTKIDPRSQTEITMPEHAGL